MSLLFGRAQLDVTFYVYDGKCNWDTLGVRIGIVPLAP